MKNYSKLIVAIPFIKFLLRVLQSNILKSISDNKNTKIGDQSEDMLILVGAKHSHRYL
jgi:hypothetical protein